MRRLKEKHPFNFAWVQLSRFDDSREDEKTESDEGLSESALLTTRFDDSKEDEKTERY